MNHRLNLVFVIFAGFLLTAGCAERVVYRSVQTPQPAPSAAPSCQQVTWDGTKWVCTASSGATIATEVVTETVVVDNVLYGVVGGFITGYWVGNVWFHGVPPRFAMPYGYRVAPRGYAVIPRGYAVPRGFGHRGRGR